MLLQRVLFVCGISIGAGACAIHPLPEDVTGDNTYEIVRKVRCEARSAVVAEAVELLTRNRASKKTQEIGREIQEGRRRIIDVDFGELDARTREHIEEYDGTAIAYEFTFDITEKITSGLPWIYLSRSPEAHWISASAPVQIALVRTSAISLSAILSRISFTSFPRRSARAIRNRQIGSIR